jgi:PIN domain nuclease of toxin-antitoxin system
MKSKIVLDASAFLALAQSEKGSEVLKPLLNFSVMSTVNVAEALTVLQRAENIKFEDSINLINDIIPTIVPFDFEQATEVAKLNKMVKHKGLSLGDRACISLGIKLQLPIYTADKAWADLNIDYAKIQLIR